MRGRLLSPPSATRRDSLSFSLGQSGIDKITAANPSQVISGPCADSPPLDNIPVLCSLSATCSPAGPERSGPVRVRAVRWLTGRTRGVGRCPRRWLLSRHRPGRRADAGRVSEAGVRTGWPGSARRDGEMRPAPTPIRADPQSPAGLRHYERRYELEGHSGAAGSGGLWGFGLGLPSETANAGSRDRRRRRHRDETDGRRVRRWGPPLTGCRGDQVTRAYDMARRRVPAASRVPCPVLVSSAMPPARDARGDAGARPHPAAPERGGGLLRGPSTAGTAGRGGPSGVTGAILRRSFGMSCEGRGCGAGRVRARVRPRRARPPPPAPPGRSRA